jgi:hypothetical protein
MALDAAAAFYERRSGHVTQSPIAAVLTGLQLTFGSTRAAL